jgi:hypothetical protein
MTLFMFLLACSSNPEDTGESNIPCEKLDENHWGDLEYLVPYDTHHVYVRFQDSEGHNHVTTGHCGNNVCSGWLVEEPIIEDWLPETPEVFMMSCKAWLEEIGE